MGYKMKSALVFVMACVWLLLGAGCSTEPASDEAPVAVSTPAPIQASTPEPTPDPAPTPEPASTPEPEPAPEPAESGYSGRSFALSFTTEDLFGNQVTESDLGEKEIFFFYVWGTF